MKQEQKMDWEDKLVLGVCAPTLVVMVVLIVLGVV
jgi:hypothetical protein